MQPTVGGKHTFGEAFMRMPYDCAKCGTREWIWNSRDGVSPFIVGCRACKGEAYHKAWNEDLYLPGHQPMWQERIFVDTTPERAREAAEQMVARSDGGPYECPADEREATIARIAADIDRGQPDLITVGPEGWRPAAGQAG